MVTAQEIVQFPRPPASFLSPGTMQRPGKPAGEQADYFLQAGGSIKL